MGSPGRFNMDDLGLNLENDEDNDFCRGYGANTNLNEDAYFGMGNEDEQEEDEDGDDHVPEMPLDFYKNVDSFLSKPAPALKGSSMPTTSKKAKTKETTYNERTPMLPSINAKQDNRMYLPQPPQVTETETVPKKKKSSKSKTETNSKRPIDNALLSEAFAYTDRLLREAVIEEQQQTQKQQQVLNSNNNRAHSTGSIGTEVPSGGRSHQKSESSNVNVLRKLKSDRQKGYLSSSSGKTTNGTGGPPAIPRPTDFNITSGEGDHIDTRRNVVDFDELVANFESGATLQKLRKELEQSKQSMANSQNYLRNMTRDLYK